MNSFATLLAILASVVLTGCSLTRNASVRIQQQGSDVEFHIRTRSINGLLGLRIWRTDTKEMLWDVNLNYYRGGHLKYGEVPAHFQTFNGNKNSAHQKYPANGARPIPLPPSTSFLLELEGQYDTPFAPSARSFIYSITTDANGRISKPKPTEKFTADDFPKPE